MFVNDDVVETDHTVKIGGRCYLQLTVDFRHHRVAGLLERLDTNNVPIDIRIVPEHVNGRAFVFRDLRHVIRSDRSVDDQERALKSGNQPARFRRQRGS